MADKIGSMNRPWRATPENMKLKPAPTSPVKCPECDATFTNLHAVVKHVETHHKAAQ